MITDEYVHRKASSRPARFAAPCALVFARLHVPLFAAQTRGGMGACKLPLWGRLTSGGAPGCGARGTVAAGTEKCGTCRHLTATAGMFLGVRAASNVFSRISTSGENGPYAASPVLPYSASRIRARAGSGPGAARARKALPARPGEPETGPKRAAAPAVQRGALCALRGVCLRAALPRADRPAQTHPWSKDEAGAGNGNDTGWARARRARARGQTWRRPGGRLYGRTRGGCGRTPGRSRRGTPRRPRATARRSHGAFCVWSSATCAAVCYCSFLSSQKRLRGGKRLRAPARSRGRPVRLCASVLFVRAGSGAVCRSVWGSAFRRLLRSGNGPGRGHSL